MTIFQAIILGIIQGVTEFLPISSSGHLVLAPAIFGWDLPKEQAFVFDVLVQLGTLVAVFIYFWHDLTDIAQAFFAGLVQRKPFAEPRAMMGWYIIIATIPAATIGWVIKDTVEATFDSLFATAIFLLITALLLLLAERIGDRSRSMETLTWRDALIVGCFQVLALFPGVSRSGSTIAGGMTRNLDRPASARFSFLMSVPIMLAAGALSIVDLFQLPNLDSFIPALLTGFVTSVVVGYFAIRWLITYLAKNPLYVFAIYVTLVSLISMAIFV